MTQYTMPFPELTPITTCTAVLLGGLAEEFFAATCVLPSLIEAAMASQLAMTRDGVNRGR
jgi:hypothetical protein